MKKGVVFLVAVLLAQSAFGWNAQDMSDGIMRSITRAGKSGVNSKIETQFLPGTDIALGFFVGCLILCPGPLVGIGKGTYEVGKLWAKASDKINNYLKENPIEWIKIYSPDKIGEKNISLSQIQIAVFRDLDADKLKQMYGVTKVPAKNGNASYIQTPKMARISSRLSSSGKAFSSINVKSSSFSNIKLGF